MVEVSKILLGANETRKKYVTRIFAERRLVVYIYLLGGPQWL